MEESLKLKEFKHIWGDTFQEHTSFFLFTQSLLFGYDFQKLFN